VVAHQLTPPAASLTPEKCAAAVRSISGVFTAAGAGAATAALELEAIIGCRPRCSSRWCCSRGGTRAAGELCGEQWHSKRPPDPAAWGGGGDSFYFFI
jgi:hypothetical protein